MAKKKVEIVFPQGSPRIAAETGNGRYKSGMWVDGGLLYDPHEAEWLSEIQYTPDDYVDSSRSNKVEFQLRQGTNLVVPLVEAAYNQYLDKLQHRSWGLFRLGDQFFAVGDAARYIVNDEASARKQRMSKFARDNYLPLVLHMILIHLGEKVDNFPEVNVMYSYPPANVNQSKAVKQMLEGKHVVEVAGTKHRIVIGQAIGMEEVTAAAMWLLYKRDGTRNPASPTVSIWDDALGDMRQRNNREHTLLIDIGSGTTDVALINNRGFPEPNSTRSLEYGINDPMQTFKRLFDSRPEYKQYIPHQSGGLQQQHIDNMMATRDKILHGLVSEPINCYDLYREAFDPFFYKLGRDLPEITQDLMPTVTDIQVVGGGGTSVFPEFAAAVYPQRLESGTIRCPANLETGIYVPVLGMLKSMHMLNRVSTHKAESR